MERLLKGCLFLAVVLVFVAAVAGGFLLILSGGDVVGFVQTTTLRLSLASRQDDLNRPAGPDESAVRFEVSPGDTASVIALNLLAAGLIHDAELFAAYARVERLDRELEAGIYFLNQTQTIPTIAQTLTDSRSSHIVFRVLEGWRLEEVAANIDASRMFGFTGADFLAVTGPGANPDPDFAAQVGLPPGASLEGFLMPDTYQLPPQITAVELRDTLTQAFLERTGPQMIADAARQGYSMYEMVTLASIIEREAVWDDEKSLISSVYRNRLNISMRLEADPTVQYGLHGERGRWWPNITQADYRNVISPYNTYLNDGLPPGPIAMPAMAAIRAAVYPAESSYFYFRAACDGSNYHVFATTYQEHLDNGC